jgi:hypothetical protein
MKVPSIRIDISTTMYHLLPLEMLPVIQRDGNMHVNSSSRRDSLEVKGS